VQSLQCHEQYEVCAGLSLRSSRALRKTTKFGRALISITVLHLNSVQSALKLARNVVLAVEQRVLERCRHAAAAAARQSLRELRCDGTRARGGEGWALCLTRVLQIVSFCTCAAASGFLHIRWRRIDPSSRSHMWRLYGWFTCLMCLGCIAGAVAWAAYMQYLAIFFAAVKAESIQSAAWFQRQQAAAGYWAAAFLFVVAAVCSRRITAAVNRSADLAAAQRVRLQILGTAAVVFLTFLLRSVFSIMFAVADALQNDSEADCSGLCDGCKNVYAHIQAWVHYTPVFRLCIILISSPLALLVALWGMTSESTLQYMRSGRAQTVRMVRQPLVAAK